MGILLGKAGDRFAVAVPAVQESGVIPAMSVIETYPSQEDLNKAYDGWEMFAERLDITRPYKIEILDESGKFKVLE